MSDSIAVSAEYRELLDSVKQTIAAGRLRAARAVNTILDINRPRRAFRRITGAALERLLPEENDPESSDDDSAEESSK